MIGGHNIKISDVPYMASLRIDGTEHFCGASIIHEKYILTAAHCIVPHRKYRVSVGSDDIKNVGKLYDIDKIIIHEKYNSSTYDYDVCVIKLKQPLEFGPSVKKIELAKTSPAAGHTVQATGWGATSENNLSENLSQVSIPVVSSLVCQMMYLKFKQTITRRMLCAGDIGRDTCEADSGGPLTHKNKQVGITSFGMSICGVKPGVYTKIKPVRKWILDIIDSSV